MTPSRHAALVASAFPDWTSEQVAVYVAESEQECAEADRLDDDREAAERDFVEEALGAPLPSFFDDLLDGTVLHVDAGGVRVATAAEADAYRQPPAKPKQWSRAQLEEYVRSLPEEWLRKPKDDPEAALLAYLGDGGPVDLDVVRMLIGRQPTASVADPERNAPLDWATTWAEAGKPVDWLVEPLIESGTSVSLYSPPKAGKSLLLLEVCIDRAGRPVVPRGRGRRCRRGQGERGGRRPGQAAALPGSGLVT